jgi:large subunit ribosomal protein L21
MYAVIKTGGKQYRVAEGDVVSVEKLEGKEGGKVTFSEVLAVSAKGGALKLGSPTVAKAKVEGEILETGKQKKIHVFKFKKNSQYQIHRGHRQPFTKVKINKISAS